MTKKKETVMMEKGDILYLIGVIIFTAAVTVGPLILYLMFMV